jgi:hypothetical protein
VELTNSSVLNLNIENLLTPAPILGSWVGFQTVSNGFTYVFPTGTTNTFTNAYTFTGSMNIGLTERDGAVAGRKNATFHERK